MNLFDFAADAQAIGMNRLIPDRMRTAYAVKRLAVLGLLATAQLLGAQRTKHVFLIVTDGLRWQDVFTGADSSIIFGQPQFTGDTGSTRRNFWRPTAEARRAAMMPFLWNTIAKEGVIYGNKAAGSSVQVTNGRKVSYPGYNEMLLGRADSHITGNDAGRNPNLTVFDWLNDRPAFAGHVEAFGTWNTFKDIFNVGRAAFPVHAGWDPPYNPPKSGADSAINRLYRTSHREFGDVAWDALMQSTVVRAINDRTPSVLFIGYGETDEWAHAGRYDNVLRSARAVDAFVAELWSLVQSIPEYKGATTFILTTDHGRGSRGRDWREHGEKINGAEDIWIAMIGPDTPALGAMSNGPRLTQSQIAATVAALLGEDYAGAVNGVAPPIRPSP